MRSNAIFGHSPPVVGAIEAISAMLRTQTNMPRQTMIVVQIVPAVPPLAREKVLVTIENSQVLPRTTT